MFLFEMNHLYSQTQFSGGKNGKYIAKKAPNAETNVTWGAERWFTRFKVVSTNKLYYKIYAEY